MGFETPPLMTNRSGRADSEASVSRNATTDDTISIEQYSPALHSQHEIRELFQEGLWSLLPDAIQHALFRSSVGWATLAGGGVLVGILRRYYNTTVFSSILVGLLPPMCLSLSIYFMWHRYIQTSLNNDMADIEKFYIKSGGVFFVALYNNTIVGIVGGEQKKPYKMELRRMSVKKARRGKRLGSRLVEALVEYATQNKIQTIFLTHTSIQYAAHGLYKRNGFALKRLIRGSLGIDIFLLERKIMENDAAAAER
jgi:GNAT superfamily N-acetyltransferase